MTEVIVGIVVVAVLCFIWEIRKDAAEDRKVQLLEQQIQEVPDFDATDIYISHSESPGVAIDKERRKIAIITQEGIKVYEATAILSCEILQDNVQIISTERRSQFGGAVAGGLIAGGVGAVIGSLSGSRISVTGIREIALRILFDDFDVPNHTIPFFYSDDAEGVDSDSSSGRSFGMEG